MLGVLFKRLFALLEPDETPDLPPGLPPTSKRKDSSLLTLLTATKKRTRDLGSKHSSSFLSL